MTKSDKKENTMKITLYSTGCPQCSVLKKKLDAANINYEVVSDQEVMVQLGFKSAPILEVDGNYFTFSDAIKWLREQK